MRRSRYVPLALMIAASAALPACDRNPTDDAESAEVGSHSLVSSCTPAPPVTTTASIGVAGGSVTAGGVIFTVPAGAVAGPTEFRVHVPSSPYAEVDIQANGQDRFQFLEAVVVSMDYSRCNATGTLSVWQIDPDTKALLQNMGGVNDVLNRRMIFSTLHLSGYAIAN